MKTKSSLRSRLLLAASSLLAVSSSFAATFTWTQDSAATQDWTDSANWSGASVYSAPGTNADTLTFFSDTTTALLDGNNNITTNVPDLTINILTLNGKGAAATGATNITIGTSANTWILDGTTPAVNLSGVLGTQALNYTLAPNLTLTQASTAFAGAGTGNFTFSGSISESASGMAISKAGASVLTLSNSNSYSGSTTITAGVLRLDHATALPGGIGTTGGNSALIFNGGVLGLGAGDFTRSLGTSGTASAVNFTGAGGWAAYGADRVVNLGGAADTVVWATANTGFNAKGLTLGATSATHMVDLQNPLDLGAATRTVTVNNGAAAIDAKLSGNITGTAGLTKAGAGALWISGNISNSAGGFTLGGSGAVKLSGTNTYSGVTTNGFANPAPSLYFLGMQALPSSTSIAEAHNGGTGGTGTIYFLDDSATPDSRSTVNLTHDQKNNSQNAMSVFVGNNGSANGGNGSGGTTGSTIELGNMNFNQTGTGATNGAGLAVNGADGYGLKLANVNVSLQALYTANWNVKLNASSAPLTVTGNVQQAAGGGTGSATTLQLDGSAVGNTISGNVLDSADGTPKTMNVAKLGTGDWKLSSASNSFTGAITMAGTTTSSGTLKYASAAGTNPITFSATTGFGSTLDYIGSSALTMSGAFTVSALTNGGITINANGTTSSDTINYSNTGSIGGSGSASSNTGFITFGGANTGDNIFASQIVNNSATMKRQVAKSGVGTWVLTGNSTYTGGFFLNQGTLKIPSVGNAVDSGPLGVLSRINIGNGNNDGTLVFTGAGSSTDREVRIGGPSGANDGTGSSIILNDGTGAVVFTKSAFNPAQSGVTNSRTLTLGGSYTGGINEIQGVIQDNTASTGLVSVTKTGASTWKLSGANTYTGATAVNGGTLALGANDVLPDTSNVSIGSATLDTDTHTDTVGTLDTAGSAVINLGSGGALAFADSSAVDWTGGTLNVTGTFVSGASIRFGTGSSALTGAQLALISVNGSGAGTYTLGPSGYLVSGGSSGYSAWQAANSTGGAINADHDGDGVSNGVEYFLTGPHSSTGFTTLPGVTNNLGTLSVTWTKAADYTGAYGTDFVVETSDTLTGTLTPAILSPASGFTVVISGNNVTYTFPSPLGTRKFVRLNVTGP